MTEAELRAQVVAEAQSWVGTPYISNGAIKGRRGGVDCAMLLLAVYQNVGLVPREFDPRPYPPQWHVHRNQEKYLQHMLGWAKEVLGSEERAPLPGDVVLFKIGHVFAHGAIITDWPNVIHAIGGDMVIYDDVSMRTTGRRALWHMPRLIFSYWG
jgi:cell wall-associated NlpC family hydrolase